MRNQDNWGQCSDLTEHSFGISGQNVNDDIEKPSRQFLLTEHLQERPVYDTNLSPTLI